MRADITHSGMRGIEGIDALSDKQILQILRCLEKHPDDGTRLRQAKAFGNKKLSTRAQKFLVKWCRRKGISVDTWDVSSVPYTV